MSIYDLKVGDKLQVLINKDSRGFNTLNDIIEITEIHKENYGLWLTHSPKSFSGGGFKIVNRENARWGYVFNKDVKLLNTENYTYLIKILKKLKIK